MRRQTNPAFGQQQTRLGAHLAVQPRIGRRCLGPRAIVQTAKDHQIRTLNAGLKRAPDHHVGMGRIAVADLSGRQNRADQVGIVRGVHRAAMRRLCAQLIHDFARFLACGFVPQLGGIIALAARNNALGKGDVISNPVGQVQVTVALAIRESCSQPCYPFQKPVGFIHFRGDFLCHPRQPGRVRIWQAIAPDLRL